MNDELRRSLVTAEMFLKEGDANGKALAPALKIVLADLVTMFKEHFEIVKEVKDDYYICYGCNGEIHKRNIDDRIKQGELRRINIKGEFKTFHLNCFKVFAKHVPDWYIIEKEN